MSKEFPNISWSSEKDLVDLGIKLAKDPVINTSLNQEIVLSTPYVQDMPEEEAIERMAKIGEANRLLPEVQVFAVNVLANYLSTVRGEDYPEGNVDFDDLLEDLKKDKNQIRMSEIAMSLVSSLLRYPERFSKEFGYEKEEYLIAVSHFGVLLSGNIYKSAEDKKLKSTALTYIWYYAALNSLFVGIRTNNTLFAVRPDNLDNPFLDELKPAVQMADKKLLKSQWTRLLFQGDAVTPINQLDEENAYFISSPGKEKE